MDEFGKQTQRQTVPITWTAKDAKRSSSAIIRLVAKANLSKPAAPARRDARIQYVGIQLHRRME